MNNRGPHGSHIGDEKGMRRQLIYMCPLVLLASAAWGSTCANTTLNVYTATSFSCTLDGLTFSDFSFLAPTGMPTSNEVDLVPVNDGTDVGFMFDGPFSAPAGFSDDAILSYMISQSTGSNTTMTGDTVSLLSAGASGTGAAAQISEGICTTTAQSNGACVPPSNSYNLFVDYNSNGSGTQSDSVTFASPATTQAVIKNIVTDGGTGTSGGALISSFENTTQVSGGGSTGGGPVPEPGSMLMLGSGLIATSMLLRRKVRKNTL